MRGCIKSFLEVQDKCVNLSAVIQDFSPIVYNSDQLSFTAVPLSECMLSMLVQMCQDIRAYYVFKQLARVHKLGRPDGNCKPKTYLLFLKSGHIFARNHSLGISPVSIDTLSAFLLTIYVSIEVSGISLNVTNQVIDIQIVLLVDTGLYFPSQSFKF